MPLFELNLPPGMKNNGTSDQAEMRWEGGSMVRWANGSMEPIGGFQQSSDISGAGNNSRKAISWAANDATIWVAYADSEDVYVQEAGGTRYSITPVDYYSSPFTKPVNHQNKVLVNLQNWGENLVICNNYDRRIYEWTHNTTPAAAVRITTANGYSDNAPTDCENIHVTSERFLFALGADGDPRKIAWSDFEDLGTWTPSSTNQAGSINLAAEGEIRCAANFNGMSVILTSREAFVAKYVGPPFIFDFEKVSEDCGVIANNAAVTTPAGVFWMGKNNFYVFNGAQVSAIPCEVRDSVFNDLLPTSAVTGIDYTKLIWAFHNAAYNEVWWFYARDNGQDASDLGSYVIYNYAENTWAIGGDDVPGATSQDEQYIGLSRLPRTCGIGPEVFGKTLWFGNVVYEHEIVGGDFVPFVGDPPYSFAMSAPFYASPSKSLVTATQMMQDVENPTNAEFWFYSKNYPQEAERRFPAVGSGNYTLSNPTDIRVTGRQFRIVIEMKPGQSMKVGKFIFDGQENGRR